MDKNILNNIIITIKSNNDVKRTRKCLGDLGFFVPPVNDFFIPGFYIPDAEETFDEDDDDEMEDYLDDDYETISVKNLEDIAKKDSLSNTNKERLDLCKNNNMIKIIWAPNFSLLEKEANEFLKDEHINILDIKHDAGNNQIVFLYKLAK